MSAKIVGEIDINDKNILKISLNELKIKFCENVNSIVIDRAYNNIVFDFKSDKTKVTYDDSDKKIIDKIHIEYAKNFKTNELNILGLEYEIVENDEYVKINVLDAV